MEFGAKQSVIERIVFWGICVLLVFAPLAFGAVHVWAYTVIEVGVFSLCILFMLDKLLFSNGNTVEWVKTPVNGFLLLILIVIGFQLVPLPENILAVISPKTVADKIDTFDILKKAGHEMPSNYSLAYYQHPVIVQGLKLFAYIAMFLLVLNSVRSKRQMDILIYILIGVGIFEAMYAVHQVFSG